MALKIAGWKPLRFLASLQLTVVGLLFMALLVIGGTFLQAEKGIYAAQRDVFQSWLFWVFGMLPLPGMLLVGALLFVNLLSAVFFRLKWKWSGLGLLLIHIGLLVLLAGGFISAQYGRECFMTLREGESSRMADAAAEWELAVWTETKGKRQVHAVDVADWRTGEPWSVSGLNLELSIHSFFPNCRPAANARPGETVLNEIEPADDPAQNIPGMVLNIRGPQDSRGRISLFAGFDVPVTRYYLRRDYYFILRLKRMLLPLSLKLLDFEKTVYPGSDIPKSFSSRVEIESAGLRREALIAMNRPLRFRGYTFYQSSYSEDGPSGTSSTFAVVSNAGRGLPYISTALMFLGLVIHFFFQLTAVFKKARPGVEL